MYTFATTSVPGGPGHRAVTVDLLTAYEGTRESTAAVLDAPNSDEPIVVYAGSARTRPLRGTFTATLGTWDDARLLLELLAEPVYLLREDGHDIPAEEDVPGTGPLYLLPLNTRHRVLADELDMHEVTFEWVRLSGGY